MLNFPYCANLSPVCFLEGIDVISFNLLALKPTADIRVRYTFDHQSCFNTLKLVDKRKDYSIAKTYTKAIEGVKRHLLEHKEFDLDHYGVLGGFLSRQTWEDNIRFSETKGTIHELINKLTLLIQNKAPFFNRTSQLKAQIHQEAILQQQEDLEFRQMLLGQLNQPDFTAPQENLYAPIFIIGKTNGQFNQIPEETKKNEQQLQPTPKQSKPISKSKQMVKDKPKVPEKQQQKQQSSHVQKKAPKTAISVQNLRHVQNETVKQVHKKTLIVKTSSTKRNK